jgi:hypothetical protein
MGPVKPVLGMGRSCTLRFRDREMFVEEQQFAEVRI